MSVHPQVTLLPDPEPREVRNVIISTDDHLVEPPDLFAGRMPSRFADVEPRIVEEDGVQAWLVEDMVLPNMGLNAVAGRPPEEWNDEPRRFEELRPGCYQIGPRIQDMDINGIWASVCFPSRVAGFGGARFAELKDKELGLACVRAWNDWHIEEWAAPYPERIIPIQVPWLCDPVVGAAEIRTNAERGFKAVSFPEVPANLGLPGLGSGYWDPYFVACQETGTVVCLHTGSSGGLINNEPGLPMDLNVSLFPAFGLISAMNWLWSGVPSRFPDLHITLAEGGAGWVPMILDRLAYQAEHAGKAFQGWTDPDHRPDEVLRRNFTFCLFDDPTAIELRDRIGVENLTIETDYPHADGTWPDSQAFADKLLGHLPERDRALIAHGNAARLFRHPLPDAQK